MEWFKQFSPSWRIEPASEEDVTDQCQNADLAIEVEMLDSFGDGWNGGYYEIRGPQGTIVGTGTLENELFWCRHLLFI